MADYPGSRPRIEHRRLPRTAFFRFDLPRRKRRTELSRKDDRARGLRASTSLTRIGRTGFYAFSIKIKDRIIFSPSSRSNQASRFRFYYDNVKRGRSRYKPMQFSTYTILWHHGIAVNNGVALSRSRLLRFSFVLSIRTIDRYSRPSRLSVGFPVERTSPLYAKPSLKVIRFSKRKRVYTRRQFWIWPLGRENTNRRRAG